MGGDCVSRSSGMKWLANGRSSVLPKTATSGRVFVGLVRRLRVGGQEFSLDPASWGVECVLGFTIPHRLERFTRICFSKSSWCSSWLAPILDRASCGYRVELPSTLAGWSRAEATGRLTFA